MGWKCIYRFVASCTTTQFIGHPYETNLFSIFVIHQARTRIRPITVYEIFIENARTSCSANMSDDFFYFTADIHQHDPIFQAVLGRNLEKVAMSSIRMSISLAK